jgi:hypothetical protein
MDMSAQDVSTKPKASARSLTAAAYWVQFLYIIWIPWTIAAGYAVYNWLGYPDPSVSPNLTSLGVRGWLGGVGLMLFFIVPNLLGAFLAALSHRRGGGRAATVALVQNLIAGVALADFLTGGAGF